MTPLALALLLQATPTPAAQTATVPASPPAASPPADPPPSAADTLSGLEETYRTTCGQTGILYYSYADLCDGLRKQIAEYRKKVEREAHEAAKPAPKR
jgi:hypothetical protein